MKTTDHLVIIFEGNTLSIMSNSDKPIQKEMDKYNIPDPKKLSNPSSMMKSYGENIPKMPKMPKF